MRRLLLYCPLLCLILFVFPIGEISAAQSTSVINATVKVSICGNGVVEGGEDCEQTISQQKACIDIGYASGALSCDISCSYDTTACVGFPPTPVVPSAVLQIPTAPTNVTASGIDGANPPVSAIEPTDGLPTIDSVFPVRQTVLPHVLQAFDRDNDGRIRRSEFVDVIQKWVTDWRTWLAGAKSSDPCDFNVSESCELRDLSILLFYIDR